MGRKTKRVHQRDKCTPSIWKDLKDYLIIFEGFTKALTHEEIYEITEFTISYAKILKTKKYQTKLTVTDYIICDDTCKDFKGCPDEITREIYQILSRLKARMSTLDPCLDLNNRFYTDFMMHLPLLSAEAMKKEFTSILTYVHYLKLTLLEEEGVCGGFRIVSEDEQHQTRKWLLMKQNFLTKWGICIEMESPEVKPMMQANVPAAGRLNPVNRRAGGKGDTMESLHFPVLEIENIPSFGKMAIHHFVCLREAVVAKTILVFMPNMPESQWAICEDQLTSKIRRATSYENRFNKVLEAMLTEEDNAIAAIDEIVKFVGELKGLLRYVSAKQAIEQAR